MLIILKFTMILNSHQSRDECLRKIAKALKILFEKDLLT